jgi:hypothetical protein
MKSAKFPVLLGAILALASGSGLCAQPVPAPAPAGKPPIRFPELPQASPLCTNMVRVGLTDITIVYSRPSARRHVVFGGIIPYSDIWRTGDNASTKISFSTVVKIGGANGGEIPAGEYALYTIPDDKEWTIIIYKDTGLWGKEGYDSKQDVGRFTVTPVKLADPVETFTMDINDIQDDSATLNLSWARVRVPIKLEMAIVPDLLVKIKESMDSSARKTSDTYLKAATFYFDHSKDLAQALDWVNVGLVTHSPKVAEAPNAYQLLYLKAKILSRQGDREGATAAAQQSLDLARQIEGPTTQYNLLDTEIIRGVRQ